MEQKQCLSKTIGEQAVQYAQEQCEHEQVDRQKEIENAFVMGAVKGYKFGVRTALQYFNKRIYSNFHPNEYDLGGTKNWTDDDWKKAFKNEKK